MDMFPGLKVGLKALLCAGLIAAALSAFSPAGFAAEPVRTYYLLVFSDPIAGQSGEFERWYREVHEPAVADVPGVVSARLYVYADTQVKGFAAPPSRYLAAYKIVSADVAAVFAEMHKRMVAKTITLSPAVDFKTITDFNAVAVGERVPSGQNIAKDGDDYLQLAYWDPKTSDEDTAASGAEGAFTQQALKTSGAIAALDMIRDDHQLKPGIRPKYLSLVVFKSEKAALLAAQLDDLVATMRPAAQPVVQIYRAIDPTTFSTNCTSSSSACTIP